MIITSLYQTTGIILKNVNYSIDNSTRKSKKKGDTFIQMGICSIGAGKNNTNQRTSLNKSKDITSVPLPSTTKTTGRHTCDNKVKLVAIVLPP